MVVVKLLSPQLRDRHGRGRLDLDAADVGQVLSRLELPDDPDLRVLVNGRSIRFLEGRATRLEPADTVSVYTMGIRGWPGG